MHTAFLVIALIAIVLQGIELYLALFGRGLRYDVKQRPGGALDSPEFCSLLAFLTEAKLLHGNQFEVLTDWPCFYEAELAAIAAARSSINLEAYIFHKGEITTRYVEALTERARAGVAVRVTLDYVGSFSTHKSYLRKMLDAGGRCGGITPSGSNSYRNSTTGHTGSCWLWMGLWASSVDQALPTGG